MTLENANDVLEAWEKRGGKRILKGLYGSVEYPSVDSLRKLLTAGRFDFLGEMSFQYRGLSPSDTSFFKYFALAEELDIPVGIHTGMSAPRTPYTCCPEFRLTLGNPYLLEDLLVKFPKLRLWAMHAGNQYFNEMTTMMNMYPQLYVDISPNSWIDNGSVAGNLERFLKRAKEQRVLNRVMYGTDQFTYPEAIEIGINKIKSLDYLTAGEKADILYNNAARFLRLSEHEIAKHYGK
jgi:predicted TIM-barrel fold metal-dependent hydrolase